MSRFCKGMKAFLGSKRGAAAVEFALIANFMVILYLGAIELSFMMDDDRRLTRVATTFGDLATRFEQLDEDTLDEIHEAARMVMLPADISDARFRLTSVVMNGGNAEVEWSIHCNWTARADGAVIAIRSAVQPPVGTSILMTEIELNVTGTFDFIPNATRTLTDTVYATPREVSKSVLEPVDLHTSYACPFQATS